MSESSANSYTPNSLGSSNYNSSSYSKSSSNSLSNTYQDNSTSNSYQTSGGYNSEQIKSQTNDFFSRKQSENMSRPEWESIYFLIINIFLLNFNLIRGLPPSQGGRYAGFGEFFLK